MKLNRHQALGFKGDLQLRKEEEYDRMRLKK